MRLKLWEKSFLLTFTIFFVLLNICLIMWFLFDMKSQYLEFADDCMSETENLLYLEEQLNSGFVGHSELKQIADMYEERGSYIRLSVDNTVLIDRLPEVDSEEMYIGRVKAGDKDYYYIDARLDDCRLMYMKSMKYFYEQYRNMAWWLLMADVMLAVVVGALLYVAMKKIYKPVNDISHELRTPLTSVLGYAQYLSMGTATEEEKSFAGEQIVKEAKYMKDIVEHLLAIDSLRSCHAGNETVDFNKVIATLCDKYPDMKFENTIQTIRGKEALIKILLTNLIENALREDPDAKLIADGNIIKIVNRTGYLSKEDIKKMNNRKQIDNNKIKGNGLGIELCWEIVKYHNWNLCYTFEEDTLNAIISI